MAAGLAELPNNLDVNSGELEIIIETPKGCRTKFSYNEEKDAFELSGILPEGMLFPYDFGFVPSTKGQDGDPLDILILMDAPAFAGCLVKARVIGVIEAEQKEDKKVFRNDRLIGVAVHSHSHIDIQNVRQIHKKQLDELEDFFKSYNAQHGKTFTILAVKGPKAAIKLVKQGRKAKKKKAKLSD